MEIEKNEKIERNDKTGNKNEGNDSLPATAPATGNKSDDFYVRY